MGQVEPGRSGPEDQRERKYRRVEVKKKGLALKRNFGEVLRRWDAGEWEPSKDTTFKVSGFEKV